jgi:DNA-directed RNA polymerase specialized sigma24 family protein
MEAAREEKYEHLPHHVFRYVEGELYEYNRKRRRARYLRDAIDRCESALARAGTGSSAGPSDPTFGRVARQETAAEFSRELARVEARLAEIRSGYEQLPSEARLLVQLKYFQRTSNELTAQQLNMSLRSFYRYRQEIIEFYARIIGES